MIKFIYLILLLFSFQLTYSQTQLDTAVDFSVKDIHGNTIDLFPILDAGNLVVIDFFSTSCGPCALYAPEVQASYEDFGENASNVFFMNIAWGDDNNGVAYFDSIYGVTSPSVSGSQGGGNQVNNSYMIISTPSVILIAPDRLILEQYIWEPTRENLNAAIIAGGGFMVGIDDRPDEQADELLIYPNPAKSMIHVQVDVLQSAYYHIETYNMLGSRVYESAPGLLSEGTQVINADLGTLPGGTYFVRLLKNGQQEKLSKIILLD